MHTKGVDIISFGTKVNESALVKIICHKFGSLPDASPLKDILADLKRSSRVTIIRDAHFTKREIGDATWLHRLRPVFKDGIYPDFLPL